MSAAAQQTYFEEQQRFPLWIKAIPLLTVVLFGLGVVALAITGAWAAALILGVTVAVLLLPLAILHFAIRLVTTLDANGLHLRIHPVQWSLLPRHMTHKDVSLADLRRWEVRTYNSLTGREYWGWHLWGLSAASDGRYLYVMRPRSPMSGRGVAVELRSGGSLIVGSLNPDDLARAINRATSNEGPR
jgi:hypothetical protein